MKESLFLSQHVDPRTHRSKMSHYRYKHRPQPWSNNDETLQQLPTDPSLIEMTLMSATIWRVIHKSHLCWTVDVVLMLSSSSLLIFCSSSLLSSKNFSLSSANVQINRFTWKTQTHFWCLLECCGKSVWPPLWSPLSPASEWCCSSVLFP